MTVYIYALHDKRFNRFERPFAKTESPEQVFEMVRAGYFTAKPEERVSALDLYILGTFDTVTAKFALESEKILVASNAVFEEEIKNVQ